jgi:hypothetical protein
MGQPIVSGAAVDLIDLAAQAAAEMGERADVVAVRPGYKRAGKILTEDPAIVVAVRRKRRRTWWPPGRYSRANSAACRSMWCRPTPWSCWASR